VSFMYTVTPGSIVKVTPSATPNGPVSIYGLFAFVHVVSELITPVTSVEACTVLKCTVPAKVNPLIMMTVKNAIRSDFRIAFPTLTNWLALLYQLRFCATNGI
jgi:hypothetical protein